jgi:LacI family transcriptional regulator
LKPEHIIISSNPADFYDIRNLLEKVLHDSPEIDAIFAITDHIAIDMVFALKSLNVNIPFDISLLSFDGFMKGQNISPKLTAIQHPAEKTAQQTVDIIRKAHANPSMKPANIYIKPEIIVGETVIKR